MTFDMNKTASRPGRKQLIAILALVVLGAIAAFAILRSEPPKASGGHEDAHGHADGEHHGEKPGDDHGHAGGHDDGEHHDDHTAKKGPHGGELHEEGHFGIEVLLAESGGSARFNAWLFQDGKPVAPGTAKVSIKLIRPDGQEEDHVLVVDKDGLKGARPVAEPHLFEATLIAQTATEPYAFTFSKEEGRVAMSDAQVKAAGVVVESASAAVIRSSLQLPGEIRFNEDRTAHVVPRVAGVVERVSADLGQRVKKGQVLAVVSSATVSEQRSGLRTAQQRLALARTTWQREKQLFDEKISPQQDVLQAEQALREAEIAVANEQQKLSAIGAGAGAGELGRYELRAPFDGMVVEKHIALGEMVKEDTNVFTISDLSTVWAELSIGAKDLDAVRVGESVNVRSTASESRASGKVSYVGSLIGEQTRTAKARVTLANPELSWRPGLFVNVEIVSTEAPAPVTVSSEALQSLEDKTVVFVRVPGGFIPQPVRTGRSDARRTEIVSGLRAGTSHAAAGSFIVKSEQGKGSAAHEH
ncbi:MAG: efflux RND transporter periplasmic adaptor subunit [Rhizobacter sp.]